MDGNSALTILLVEDDSQTVNAFVEYADQIDDVDLIGVTATADEALKLIQDRLPQAIILDLELQKGSGSGLDVLHALPSLALKVQPYILVVTNSLSDATIEYARTLGVDYFISKYQGGYSEQYVLNFLRPMREAIQRHYCTESMQEGTPETPAQKRKRIVERIHTELDNIGINPSWLGYKYLTDGILLTMEHPRFYLCNEIAQKYGKSEASVERAMQNAINRAWEINDIDEILKHYKAKIHSDRGVPSLLEFVYHYANRIGNEYDV